MHVRCEMAPLLHYSRDIINCPNSFLGTKYTIIRYLYISHNTPCFLLGYYIVVSKQCLCFLREGEGAHKVFYGRCANGEYYITDLLFSHSIVKKYIQAHPFLLHFMSFSLYFIPLYKKEMHWPGIEPGPPAWQARILPLNHRCLADD